MSTADPFQDLVTALRCTHQFIYAITTSEHFHAASSPSVIASHMAKPAPFSGAAEDGNGFILQCSLVLEMQPHLFPDDKAKVAFILQQLDGLDPRVRLHLAAYEDTIGLEKFIQLSIRFVTRMQLCIEEHQNQQLFDMQIDKSRLSPAERQRRLTQGLCLYCGHPGHFRAECPTRPVRSMEPESKQGIEIGIGIVQIQTIPNPILHTLNHQNPLTIIPNLTAADICLPVNAFIDSGSAGNFISGALCRQLNIKTVSSPKVYQIHAVTGRPLRQVRHMVGPLRLQIGILHQEEIHMLVLEDSTSDVILGHPWLEQHDPIISWRTGDVLKWVLPVITTASPSSPGKRILLLYAQVKPLLWKPAFRKGPITPSPAR
ncbi:Retrotransposon-derived protein PEG10 [Anabarilius grahami]|uniref:Retrotransposon-derived protein PEG10 n=1 Tax=Anabarilius grahami TaxID=495550 RepID=A0A3N0Y7Z0_ANAGA|nr:Retrotransposon-derived protein PEG10 [Anabarilius grahami]